MSTTPIQLELLAPARDCEIGRQAILHGADAVYIGAPSHGARAAAGNSIDDIKTLTEFAHRFNARIYVTVNTIVFDHEIKPLEQMIRKLWQVDVDALIIQDLGLLRMDLPDIALHASTQCNVNTPEKARFFQEIGFSQIVLPREFTPTEIAKVKAVTDIPLEAFVHGALCVSHSGDCQAGYAICGRSANRGECPQICRLPFDLIDGDGRTIIANKHLLSLRDMNRINQLPDLIDAGVSSFKIEGRLKDARYVKNVVAAYSDALNAIVENSSGKLQRRSCGRIERTFTPNLDKSFNRGYTPYIFGLQNMSVASINTPKWAGETVAVAKRTNGNHIEIERRSDTLNNGDGLGFFNANGEFEGFRLNRADGLHLYTARPITIQPGTTILRNSDKRWNDIMDRDSAKRLIKVDFTLRQTPHGICLDASDSRGHSISVTEDCHLEPASSEQQTARRQTLSKLGGTDYTMGSVNDNLPKLFVPASLLTRLRRSAIDALSTAQSIAYRRDTRNHENTTIPYPESCRPLTYHDNVANRAAVQFYAEHGVMTEILALEARNKNNLLQKGLQVMTTTYCLRRELGYCLKNAEGKRLKSPLTLKAQNAIYRLDFDCRRCGMNVIMLSDQKS